MEPFALLDTLTDRALLLGLSSTRIAAAFMLLPLFTTDLIPALIRNVMVMTFAVLVLALQPTVTSAALGQVNLLALFGKEVFIGCSIGFMFGSVLWAFEAAGAIIDAKVGNTSGQLTDPLTGQQTPLSGAFLGRLANFVFMFSGGLLLLMGTVIESYSLWPLLSFKPILAKSGIALFEAEFGRMMLLCLMLAAPVLVVLYAVDGILGLVNRFAPQLNLFSMAASLKTWVSTLMVMLLVTSWMQQLIADIQSRPIIVLRTLRALFGGG